MWCVWSQLSGCKQLELLLLLMQVGPSALAPGQGMIIHPIIPLSLRSCFPPNITGRYFGVLASEHCVASAETKAFSDKLLALQAELSPAPGSPRLHDERGAQWPL